MISLKFLHKGHGWPRYTWHRNNAGLSRVHERYIRQMTDRQMDDDI